MKHLHTICISIALVAIVIILTAATNQPKPKKQSVCVVSNDMKEIKAYIEVFTNKGYEITTLESQSVSISIAKNSGYETIKQLKGDMILVLTKN